MALRRSGVLGRVGARILSLSSRRDDPRFGYRYLLPMQAAGITLTYENALQLSTVWACVNAIATSIACCKWRIFEKKGRTLTLLPDDPLDYIFNVRANPETTAIAAKEALLFQAATWGNAYCEIQRDGAGRPIAWWPLQSQWVRVERTFKDDGTPGDLTYRHISADGEIVFLRPEQVFHMRGPCSVTALMGDNLVARAAKTIALAIAQERFGSSFYANGTVVGTILKTPKALSKERADQLRDEWNDAHAGPDRANRVAVLHGGMDITSAAMKPNDYNLDHDRKFQVEEICRFFNVPPHKVQHLERATFNNIEHLGLEYVRDCITPWVERLAQEADFKLIPQRAPWRTTRIDTEWLSHGDALSRASYYEKMHNIGVMSANDIREREGMNTIGSIGDNRYIMSNYTTKEGIQAMVDQTNLENEALAHGAPDATPTLRDPANDPSESFGGVANASLAEHARRLIARGQRLLGIAGAQDIVRPKAIVEVLETPALTAGPPAPTSATPGQDALAAAVKALAIRSLTAYGRRIAKRREDLEKAGKKTPAQIASVLADLRAQTRPGLLEELQEAWAFLPKECAKNTSVGDFLAAADAIDTGAEPDVVVTGLLERATGNGAQPLSEPTAGVQGCE
jgi:HK97 family phage portal protein